MSFITEFIERATLQMDDSFALQTLNQIGSDYTFVGYEENIELTEQDEDDDEDFHPELGAQYVFHQKHLNILLTVTVSDNDYSLGLLGYDDDVCFDSSSVDRSPMIPVELNRMVSEYIVAKQDKTASDAQEAVAVMVQATRPGNSM